MRPLRFASVSKCFLPLDKFLWPGAAITFRKGKGLYLLHKERAFFFAASL